MRYKRLAPSVLLWEEAAVGVTAADSTVLYENENLNDDIDLSFLDATSSVVVWSVRSGRKGKGRGESFLISCTFTFPRPYCNMGDAKRSGSSTLH